MIPELDEDGGEWANPDDYDAVAIADMAESFRVDKAPGYLPNIESAWAGQETGGIEWCWQNADAWEILTGDVDREWFMEQVMTRTDPAEVDQPGGIGTDNRTPLPVATADGF